MHKPTLRQIFKAFQYRDFRLMWIGACTSSIGTWMQIVAQGWLIYRLSHSAFLLALDQFLAGIPIFLFSLIGGVVADRSERRKILLISQYIQMGSAAVLTLVVATGLVHVWMILCLSFVSGLAQAFGGPAYQALIPTLVEREDMPNAIALNSIQFNLAVTVGPALAGITLARFGEKWCFGLNASFVSGSGDFAADDQSAIHAAEIIGLDVRQPEAGNSIRPQTRIDGSADRARLLHDRAQHADAHLHPRVRERHLPSRPGNLRQPALADGRGIDLRIARRRRTRQHLEERPLRPEHAHLPGRGHRGLLLSKLLPISYTMLVLVGASMMAVFATVTSLVQLITTNEMRGRVMSVYNCAFRGGMPLGNLVSGWLVPAFTAPVVLGVNGVLLILVALYFLVVQRRVAML